MYRIWEAMLLYIRCMEYCLSLVVSVHYDVRLVLVSKTKKCQFFWFDILSFIPDLAPDLHTMRWMKSGDLCFL